MDVKGRVVVVTGGGRGIGASMCVAFARAEAELVVVSDVDEQAATQVANDVHFQTGSNVVANKCDVSQEVEVQQLVRQTVDQVGRIDIFCSNAGITVKGGIESSNDDWQKMWEINVMSRLYAARAVVPLMLERGEGYLVQTASAAAILTEIGSASYSVTKHADLALAEWLAVTYGRSGIRVSCVCPLGVETDMLDHSDPIHQYLQIHSITADQAAESILAGITSEKFLVLPHPQVADFFRLKTEDYDRYVRGMQRMRQKLTR